MKRHILLAVLPVVWAANLSAQTYPAEQPQRGVARYSGAVEAAVPPHAVAPQATVVRQTLAQLPAAESVSSWPTGEKLVALTFDDGPHPTITPKMVALLERKGAKGTFFVSGASMSAYKKTAADWLTRPCVEIASHTWTHPQLHKVSAERVASELSRTAAIVAEVTGKKMTMMRPPYGATNAKTNELIRANGYVSILWDVDTNDWRKRTAAQMTAQVIAEARDGSIILMHDRYDAGVEATANIIDALHAKGYKFVTVSELLSRPRLRTVKPASMPKIKPTAKPATAKPATAKPAIKR